MDKIVGMIGLGIMGGAIAPNLIERGWTVIGYDVDASKANALVAVGLVIAGSVTEVARRASTIMTSLPSPKAAHTVAEEIAKSSEGQRIVIELSTLTIADKNRFRDILATAGHVALDCPLSGTGAQAQIRDLVVYASGDGGAIEASLPLFADFAKQSADLGAYGNGSKMKFIANHLVAINNVATAEALVLAERAGLNLQQVVDVVGPGAGGSRVFQLRAPMMVKGIYEPATMRVSTWKKDMAIIGEFADSLNCPTPVFTSTQRVYTDAMAMGLADSDTAAVFKVLDEQAGSKT